jgi:hypothetical protein
MGGDAAVTIIACGQAQIAPDECIECGGWLHAEVRGGVPGPCGRYCGEDCAASAAEHAEQQERSAHLHARDLLCDCEVCRANGYPTDADYAEYQVYADREATHGS